MFFISKSKELSLPSASSSVLSIRRDAFPRCSAAAAQAFLMGFFYFLFYSAVFFWHVESFDKYLHVSASD